MKSSVILGSCLVVGLMLATAVANGQENQTFQYAAKFICGRTRGDVVARGTYFTAINVHNPTRSTIRFRKKFAIALPAEKAGPVTRFFEASLGPDEALEIDCPDIVQRTQDTSGFIKGFAVIESDVELDIVAVYTAAGANGQVETLHMERVSPRRLTAGRADLVPVPDPRPGIRFCKRVDTGPDRGKLVVTVKNQGTADAPASVTRVEFSPGGAFLLATPPIPAGGSVDLAPLAIPGVCFNPDCDFRISVDANSQVTESDEGNNSVSGNCLG